MLNDLTLHQDDDYIVLRAANDPPSLPSHDGRGTIQVPPLLFTLPPRRNFPMFWCYDRSTSVVIYGQCKRAQVVTLSAANFAFIEGLSQMTCGLSRTYVGLCPLHSSSVTCASYQTAKTSLEVLRLERLIAPGLLRFGFLLVFCFCDVDIVAWLIKSRCVGVKGVVRVKRRGGTCMVLPMEMRFPGSS